MKTNKSLKSCHGESVLLKELNNNTIFNKWENVKFGTPIEVEDIDGEGTYIVCLRYFYEVEKKDNGNFVFKCFYNKYDETDYIECNTAKLLSDKDFDTFD